MPLWVKPSANQQVSDVMQHMRSHYDGTALDAHADIGAGAFQAPFRNSPLTWSSSITGSNKKYTNERTIAQSPTGWSIVCQSRPNVPLAMAALMWYGIDDSSTSVHFPVYGSVTRIPKGWEGPGPQDGVAGPMMTFDLGTAFYAFNLVANWAYTRWEVMYPEVYKQILAKESSYMSKVNAADPKILAMLNAGDVEGAVEYMTSFSCDIGETLLKEWVSFFGELFVKYRDGFVTTAAPHNPVCGCSTSSLSYDQTWYDRIANETGDRYVVSSSGEVLESKLATIPKHTLRAFN